MKASAQLRSSFLDYFERRGHARRPSAPIVPQGDSSLMFNSAGMVPFKPYFLGERRDLSRAVSSQKCFRTTDIDRVGQTLRHLTFFEMLGNFSFGDYFKEDAVAWAWEFLTRDAGLDPARLHPTVFRDDDEAVELWRKAGCRNPARRLGEDTNFWAMGATGPCGPCSEIYYDLGPAFASGAGDEVGGDGDRYLEIWNLVFMRYDRREDGTLSPLERPCIDTGMGLERLAFVAQGAESPFRTDLFEPVSRRAAELLGVSPDEPRARQALRVIADHSRAATMLLAEGLLPSNAERGYVLRRLLRRAARYGQVLGREEPFLHELVPAVVGVFAGAYPELRAAEKAAAEAARAEEAKFRETLRAGESELRKLLDAGGAVVPGAQAFRLYETFGFPLELTREIAAARGLSVDEAGFSAAREEAAEKARASWRGSGQERWTSGGGAPTGFVGYERLEERALVRECRPRDAARPGPERFLILESTPFYAEGGGQVGDTGWIYDEAGAVLLARVLDTRKEGGVFVHAASLEPGRELAAGARVLARVDAARRARVAAHHTATHLLNEALRRALGPGVRQAGSYVGPDKLRFDFTHARALSREEVEGLEREVSRAVAAAHPVGARCRPASDAAALGAVSLLGEEYGESPRFLLIGPRSWDDPRDRYSLELCGGTHVSNTREIGAFRVVKESSASSGVRRIEAVAGPAAEEFLSALEAARRAARAQLLGRRAALLEEFASLGAAAAPGPEAGEGALKAEIKGLEGRLSSLKAARLAEKAGAGREVLEVKGVKLSAQRLEGADPKSLRGLADKAKAELGSGLVFLAAPAQGRLSFVLAATPDLAARGVDAAALAKAFAAAREGSAGGRADFAQGGARDGDWGEAVRALAGLI